jgi:hypothetical protein
MGAAAVASRSWTNATAQAVPPKAVCHAESHDKADIPKEA